MKRRAEDIVDRLLHCGVYMSDGAGDSFGNWRPQSFRVDPLCAEAAIEIERLRREVQRLGIDLNAAWGENIRVRGLLVEKDAEIATLRLELAAAKAQIAVRDKVLAAADRDGCGFCSGGPVVNSDCPIHGEDVNR